VIALPPLDGATNATEIEPLPCVEVGVAGALGTVAGGRMPEGGAERPRPPIDLTTFARFD